MKLTLYILDPDIVEIRPLTMKRDWMDNTPERFAYRCLPLNIANSYGWSLHLKRGFSVIWDGGVSKHSLKLSSDAPDIHRFALSNFGSAVLSFFVYGIFRTESDWNLYVTGPPNNIKDGIVPLSGIIETDWSPYRFTMNWKVTRPNTMIEFQEGEPFCTIFPVQRGVLEEIEPEIRPMQEDPELLRQHRLFMAARAGKHLEHQPATTDPKEAWKKKYFLGINPDDSPGCPAHQTKTRMKTFKVDGFEKFKT